MVVLGLVVLTGPLLLQGPTQLNRSALTFSQRRRRAKRLVFMGLWARNKARYLKLETGYRVELNGC